VAFWLPNHCFYGKKWTGNNYFSKNLSTNFNLNFIELQHTLLTEPIGPREKEFAKIGSFEFSVEPILPVKAY